MCRAALQKPVDEAPGRAAEIADLLTSDVDAQRRQGVVQLVAAARHEPAPLADLDPAALLDGRSRLVDDLPVDRDLGGQYCGARLGPRPEHASHDEQRVEPLTHRLGDGHEPGMPLEHGIDDRGGRKADVGKQPVAIAVSHEGIGKAEAPDPHAGVGEMLGHGATEATGEHVLLDGHDACV